MSSLTELTTQLTQALELSPGQIEAAAAALASPEVADATKADFLWAVSAKGETAGEVAGFARGFLNI